MKCMGTCHDELSFRILRMRLSMRAGEHRKGKYAPLQSLVPRLGAHALLRVHPTLLAETLQAMRVPAVCPSASALLETLLQHLLAECRQAHGTQPKDRQPMHAALHFK